MEAQKKIHEESLKLTIEAIAAVRTINPSSDARYLDRRVSSSLAGVSKAGKSEGAVQEGEISMEKRVFSPPKVAKDTEFFHRVYRFEVFKQGSIFRQGKIISSNWKPIFAAVSRSGFFHYFDNSEAGSPSFSINLFDCLCAPAQSIHPHCLEIEQPNYNMFSLSGTPVKHYFKCNGAEDMFNWVTAIGQYCRELPKAVTDSN